MVVLQKGLNGKVDGEHISTPSLMCGTPQFLLLECWVALSHDREKGRGQQGDSLQIQNQKSKGHCPAWQNFIFYMFSPEFP